MKKFIFPAIAVILLIAGAIVFSALHPAPKLILFEQELKKEESKYSLADAKFLNQIGYIKEYSYGTYNSIDYPEDTIKAWKKDHELNPNHFYISAYSDLVGHGVKIYRKTNYLLPGSQLTDTIPQKVYYSDMEGNETIHYMVGGDVFGECIRITPNYEAISERKKNKKHKR